VAQRTSPKGINSGRSKRFIVRWDIEIWRFDTIAEVDEFTSQRVDRNYTVYDGSMMIRSGSAER
jgi:hypothetical protein